MAQAFDRNLIDEAVTAAKAAYKNSHPQCAGANGQAVQFIPGGTTRSVAAFEPFPLRVSAASGVYLECLDGTRYVDFCGDFTAALFGHNPEVVSRRIESAVRHGWSLGSSHEVEIEAAMLLTDRFPAMERVRFTNSGTEANLLSIALARHLTKRRKVVAFKGAFHGSLLAFDVDAAPLNVPFEFIVVPYNNAEAVKSVFDAEGSEIACVIVEPMQGAGGCIPADRQFLSAVRECCDAFGALLIIDEVMTSRLHVGGLHNAFDISPDIMTAGKYLAGGLSIGAFGGRDELMSEFGAGRLRHSGTFNNNVFSMSAVVGVLEALSPERIIQLNTVGDELRMRLGDVFDTSGLPMWVTGMGSMMHFHSEEGEWIEWLFHGLLSRGIFTAPRGFISVGFESSEQNMDTILEGVSDWIEEAHRVLGA